MNIFTDTKIVNSYKDSDIVRSFDCSINELGVKYRGEYTNCFKLMASETFSKSKILSFYSTFRNSLLRRVSNNGLKKILIESERWNTLETALSGLFINASIQIEKSLIRCETLRRINKNIFPEHARLELLLLLG